MNKPASYIPLLFIPLFLIFLSGGCSSRNDYVKVEGMIWNTLYHITYKGDKNLSDSILPTLGEVEKSLSIFNKASLVSLLNDTDRLEVDGHFIKVYDASQKINRLSNGNFDPTVSPLIDAWGFGRNHTPSLDTLAIDSILNFVGINKTRRESSLVIKEDRRTRFNFSAIAKGYGCDALGDMFKRNGVIDFMIEIGGELTLSGKSPSGADWKIAVDAPVEDIEPGKEAALVLSLSNVGIATSGNYRNYRSEGGQTLGHTISPLTGRPKISEILSATVIASNCMEADAIATACMAGTYSETVKLLEDCKVEGLLIFADSLWMTPGFRKYILQ